MYSCRLLDLVHVAAARIARPRSSLCMRHMPRLRSGSEQGEERMKRNEEERKDENMLVNDRNRRIKKKAIVRPEQ